MYTYIYIYIYIHVFTDSNQQQCDSYLWVIYLSGSFLISIINMKAYRLSVFLTSSKVYIYIFTYMFIYIHIYIYIYIYMYTYVYIYIYIHIHMYIYIHIYIGWPKAKTLFSWQSIEIYYGGTTCHNYFTYYIPCSRRPRKYKSSH
jgi:hypothetical protein